MLLAIGSQPKREGVRQAYLSQNHLLKHVKWRTRPFPDQTPPADLKEQFSFHVAKIKNIKDH